MTSKAYMAIMSHLSDAQQLIDSSTKEGDTARQYINLAKMILRKYKDDIKQEVEWSELDKLWIECKERFGNDKLPHLKEGGLCGLNKMKDGGKIVNSNISFDWDNIDDIKRLEEILKQGFAREISSFEIYNEPFNDISITAYNNNNAIVHKTVINLLAQNGYKLGEDYTIIDNIFYRLIPEWVKFQSVEEFGLSKEMLGELIKENPMMWKLSEDGKNVLFNKRINIFKKQNNGKANNKNNRK